jgi:UDP-N-acetylglucosamine 2-epimerase (hydrolysing)
LGLPSLDVGTRQNDRAKAYSVINCNAFELHSIAAFLKNAWAHKSPRDESFGQGNAKARFVEALLSPSFWRRSLQKNFAEEGLT